MYRCSLHFVDCKWELTTCASKHSLVYAIDGIQISDKKWGCARDKGSKAEPEFNVLISIWGLCWCNPFGFFWERFSKESECESETELSQFDLGQSWTRRLSDKNFGVTCSTSKCNKMASHEVFIQVRVPVEAAK